MLRITCPGCQSKLNAKEKLIGQTRKCPKCGGDVLIQAPAAPAAEAENAAEDAPVVPVEPPQETEGLARVVPVANPPNELAPPNKYLICDRQRIIAVWEADGAGWQLKTPSGLISAKRNTEQIPQQGTFRLIELRITRGAESMYVSGIVCHELAPRWALPVIARGDNLILDKIVGPSGISRDQKLMVRRYLQDTFMPEVWRKREELVEFLSNEDIHTQGIV
ncbi:MAG: hypothetical protein PHO07_00585 [Pirellulales bacterium]|jgi:hypothetical protein|nr:hypothetical protein [Thermoguttaceae bacterium]MDD4785641.1 hypothetical protein [Pirellulales bacterium]NLZ00838.1 hypothetical protein [Pirellulaceae bacterium]